MEFDWWTKDLWKTVAYQRQRHFQGRDRRGKTLWSSFILQKNKLKLFICGDSWY
jgi:hypothetical protein